MFEQFERIVFIHRLWKSIDSSINYKCVLQPMSIDTCIELFRNYSSTIKKNSRKTN